MGEAFKIIFVLQFSPQSSQQLSRRRMSESISIYRIKFSYLHAEISFLDLPTFPLSEAGKCLNSRWFQAAPQ